MITLAGISHIYRLYGFFGVMCSIIPKNMFKWLQCIWKFLSFDEQCETTCQCTNLTFGFISGFSSFEIPLKATIKTYKTKPITNQVWEWFWLPININKDEYQQGWIRIFKIKFETFNSSIDISMILLRMGKRHFLIVVHTKIYTDYSLLLPIH